MDRVLRELNTRTIYSTLELETCISGIVYAKMATADRLLTVKTACVKYRTVRTAVGVVTGEHVLRDKSCTKLSSCNLGCTGTHNIFLFLSDGEAK